MTPGSTLLGMDTIVVALIGLAIGATLLHPRVRNDKGYRNGAIAFALFFAVIAIAMYTGGDTTSADMDVRRGY